MQKYTFEPIPEGTIVLFRESERDPYWCQVCGEKYKSACSALAHGRKLHSQDERTKVTTVTGQKPVSSEAKLSWRQAYLEGYRRKQQGHTTQLPAGPSWLPTHEYSSGGADGPLAANIYQADAAVPHDTPCSAGAMMADWGCNWGRQLTRGFVSALPGGAVLGATVNLDTKLGHVHTIQAWYGAAVGQTEQRRFADRVDFCIPGDISMERSCQVAYLWWKLNRPHLLRVLGSAKGRESSAVLRATTSPMTLANLTSIGAPFAVAIVAGWMKRAWDMFAGEESEDEDWGDLSQGTTSGNIGTLSRLDDDLNQLEIVGWVFQASERKAPSKLFLEDGTGVAMLTLSEGQEEWLRGEVGAAKDLCVRVVGTADEELRRATGTISITHVATIQALDEPHNSRKVQEARAGRGLRLRALSQRLSDDLLSNVLEGGGGVDMAMLLNMRATCRRWRDVIDRRLCQSKSLQSRLLYLHRCNDKPDAHQAPRPLPRLLDRVLSAGHPLPSCSSAQPAEPSQALSPPRVQDMLKGREGQEAIERQEELLMVLEGVMAEEGNQPWAAAVKSVMARWGVGGARALTAVMLLTGGSKRAEHLLHRILMPPPGHKRPMEAQVLLGLLADVCLFLQHRQHMHLQPPFPAGMEPAFSALLVMLQGLYHTLEHRTFVLRPCTYPLGKDVLTEEQARIVGAYVEPGECLLVEAYAGTGKTFTLRAYAASMAGRYPNKKMLYLAFNRSVKEQAARTFPPNVVVHSWHSLAYKWFLGTHGGREDQLGGFYYGKKEIWETVKQYLGPRTPKLGTRVNRVWRTLERWFRTDDGEAQPKHVPKRRVKQDGRYRYVEAETADEDAAAAQHVWACMIDPAHPTKLPLDGTIKLMQLKGYDLSKDRERYGVVMLDEAQDTNPVAARFLEDQPRVAKLLVGDSRQAINGWRGARNFMAKVRGQSPDNPHLELSLARSFRIGREIASVSDAIIRYGWKLAAGGPTHYGAAAARGAGGPRTKPANLVGVGPDGRVLFIQEADGPWPKFPYTVITRTNRQIVHEFRRLRRREHAAQAQGQAGHTHIKVAILGCTQQRGQQGFEASPEGRRYGPVRRGGLEKQWEQIRDLACLLLDEPDRMLNARRFNGLQSWDRVVAEAEEEEDEEILRLVSELEEEHESGRLGEFIDTIDEMLSEAVAADEADVLLTTTHRAKGLEFARVVVASDFNPRPTGDPSALGPEGISDRQLEEVNLAYVACSRALQELYVCTGELVELLHRYRHTSLNSASAAHSHRGVYLTTTGPPPNTPAACGRCGEEEAIRAESGLVEGEGPPLFARLVDGREGEQGPEEYVCRNCLTADERGLTELLRGPLVADAANADGAV